MSDPMVPYIDCPRVRMEAASMCVNWTGVDASAWFSNKYVLFCFQTSRILGKKVCIDLIMLRLHKYTYVYTQKNLLCIHKRSLVHAQHSCACSGPGNPGARDPKRQRSGPRILCMHKNLVHAQYTLLFLHNNKYCSEAFPYQRWDFLVHLHLHSRLRRIQWHIVIVCCINV